MKWPSLYLMLNFLFLIGLSACSDDSPTGTGTWDRSLVLFPANDAILTEGFNVSVKSFGADSMVVYLDGTRVGADSMSPLSWPVGLTEFEAGEHVLTVTVFEGKSQTHLTSEILICHGIGPKVGNYAPSFTLPRLDGTTYTYDPATNNQVILLDYWASWCSPCVRALPETQALFDDFTSEGLLVLTTSGEDEETVRTFIENNGYTFPVLLDSYFAVRYSFDVSSIPKYIIIDERGIIRYVRVGGGGTPPLADVVKPLLSSSAHKAPS